MVLDVGEPAVRADQCGQRAALLVGVLDAEPPARPQQPRGGDQQAADDVQPVRAAPQRQRRVVVGDLARHAGTVGHVGRVGDDEVDRAVELAEQLRIGHVAGQHLDRGVPRGRPGGRVVPGPLDRARVALHGDDAGAGMLVRDRQRQRAGAGTEVDDERRVGPGQPLQRPPGELLGLRPRHEDAGADGELEVAEGRAPGEVLQRHPVRALVEQRGEPGGRRRPGRRPASAAGRGTPRGRRRAAARRPPGATRPRRRRAGGRRRPSSGRGRSGAGRQQLGGVGRA